MAGPPRPLTLGSKPAAAPSYAQPVEIPVHSGAADVVPVTQTVPLDRQVTQLPISVNTSLQRVALPAGGSPLTREAVNAVGRSSQQQVADISSRLASAVKTSQMDELGDLLGKTLVAAKGFDPSTTKGSFFGLIKRKIEEIRIGYESADSTVNRLVGQIDNRVATHRQRDGDIKQMIEGNRKAYEALGPEIEQLLARVEWMEANVPAVDANNPMSAQRVQEWQTVCVMGRKHADDLTRTRAVCLQMDAQMQQLKQQGLMLVQKFDSFKTTTLPVLRQAFVMYILALEQEKSAKMANSVDDLTDNTLKANAKKLGQTTAAVHGSLARSNVSLEAIQAGHTAMLESLNEIDRIRVEMKQRLATEAPQIEQLNRELTARLARPATA